MVQYPIWYISLNPHTVLDFTMPKTTTMLLAGMTFSTGLLLGLVLHLPGAHSPDSPRTRQDQQPLLVHRLKRSLLETTYKERETGEKNVTFESYLNRETTDLKHRKEIEITDNDLGDKQTNEDLHKNSPAIEAEWDSVYRDGLSHSISSSKQPSGHVFQSQTNAGIGINHGVKGIPREQDTSPVNIEASSREQGPSSLDKHSMARSMGLDKSADLTQQTDNEIEIDLKNDISKDIELNTGTDSHAESSSPKKSLQSLGIRQVVEGVYWSPEAELLVPEGFSQDEVTQWRDKLEGTRVVGMREGCGRMQNRLLTLADGSQACARYRLNTDQIQGEIYSYFLAHILDIPNVPPSVLQQADSKSPQWAGVNMEVVSAQWHPSKVVILTPWLEDLTPAYIPEQLRDSKYRKLHPDNSVLKRKSPHEISDLVQWSDLIIFDYLTANLDRVVNNMFNLQWNSGMMESPAHNLEKSARSGHLVFLDNESGLFHSYRLLQKYSEYHEDLLTSLCVFRKRTADAIERLHQSRDIGVRIQTTFEQNEPLWRHLPRIPQQNLQVLQTRIDNVYNQIQHCQSLFSANTKS